MLYMGTRKLWIIRLWQLRHHKGSARNKQFRNFRKESLESSIQRCFFKEKQQQQKEKRATPNNKQSRKYKHLGIWKQQQLSIKRQTSLHWEIHGKLLYTKHHWQYQQGELTRFMASPLK
jgi:hypothetical protein